MLKRQSIKSSLYTYFGVGIGFVSSVVILPHIFVKEHFGLLQILLSLPILFSEYIGLGFTTIMTRLFYRFNNKEKGHNGFLFIWLIWFCCGILFFLITFIFFREHFISKENNDLLSTFIWWGIPLTITNGLYLFFEKYLRYIHLNASFSIFLKEVLTRVGVLFIASFYYFDYINFDQFVPLFCLCYMLPSVLLILKLWQLKELNFTPQFGFIDRPLLLKIFRIAGLAIFLGVLSNVSATFTNLFLAKWVNLSAVTIISIATIFANLISVPMRVAHSLSEPLLRESFSNGNVAKAFQIYQKSCFIQTVIGLFFYLVIFHNINNIMKILPPDYAEAKILIIIICLGTLFDMMTGVNDVLIGTSSKYHYASFFPAIMAILTVSLNVVLIPKYGLLGAAIAIMLVYIIFNFIRFLFIFFFLDMQPYNQKYLIILLAALGLGLFMYLIPHLSNFIVDGILRTSLISLIWLFFTLKFNFSPELNSVLDTFSNRLFKFKLSDKF